MSQFYFMLGYTNMFWTGLPADKEYLNLILDYN